MHKDNSHVLNPLGQTAAQFADAAAGRVLLGRLGGRPAAMLAYRRAFRDGARAQPAGRGEVRVDLPPIARELREHSPEGEVVKFLLRLDRPGDALSDDQARATALAGGTPTGTGLGRDVSHRFEHLDVESVLIPMVGSSGARTYTLCVSSQIGCAMGCTFCETGQMGLIRSLTPDEIVAQWYTATHVLGIRPKNIVFMGMGEPMDNLDHVLQAIAVLKDHDGAAVPISQITVSTVGRVDGIEKLAAKVREPGWHRLGLALSLNAPNDAARSAIMPINRRWNLADVQKALLAWPQRSGNKVCIEYVLIPGVNDSRDNAREIAEFFRPFGLLAGGRVAGQTVMAVLNLIPYNPRRNSPWPAPSEERVAEFMGWLTDLGVFTKRRRTKGREMMGACGQLGTESIRKRQFTQPTISGA